MDTYSIKDDYRCNLETVQPIYSEDASLAYQRSVYEYARDMISPLGVASVLDVGCGLGLKLEKYIQPTGVAITGVDGVETIALCKARHRFGNWISDDIENPSADLGARYDLVISADVIEHLIDPDQLLAYLLTWAAPGAKIILSTPERDLRRGLGDMGPPANRSHVREWNRDEFFRYLTSRRIEVLDHRIVALRDDVLTCQLVRCQAG